MRQRQVATIIFSVFGILVDYLAYTLLPSIPPFVIGIIAVGIFVVGVILWKTAEEEQKPTQAKAVFDLQPLPHHRGYIDIKASFSREEVQGMLTRYLAGTLKGGQPIFTDPDAKLLAESQMMTAGGIDANNKPINEFIAKFGVVRVKALSGSAKNVRAEVRHRRIGRPELTDETWLLGGYLNWFSPELKQSLGSPAKFIQIDNRRALGINNYLLLSEQAFTQGDERDLLVFYMIKDIPTVFLCSSIRAQPLGTVRDNQPVQFEVEITLTGEGCDKAVWRYQGSALWDDFKLFRANLPIPEPYQIAPQVAHASVEGHASLDLVPLPHYRGYFLPQDQATVTSLRARAQALNLGITKAELTEPTDPDAKLLKDCQWITLYGFNQQNIAAVKFIAKFGAIRVHCVSGNVRNCKAEVRFRTLEEGGKLVNDDWRQGGYLNWFSPELKQAVGDRIMGDMENPSLLTPMLEEAAKYLEAEVARLKDKPRGLGINKYLLNSRQDFSEGQTSDLLAFYMIEGVANVFLCSSLESQPLGVTVGGNPAKFEIEITLTGEGYTKTVWRFRGSARWDDFETIKVE